MLRFLIPLFYQSPFFLSRVQYISCKSIWPDATFHHFTIIKISFIIFLCICKHFNHCIVLGDCDNIDSENTEIQCCKTEQDVLLAWKEIINKEDPDIIIGYNIFGFDFSFMFKRAIQLDCVEEFLELSRNKDEVCGMYNEKNRKWEIE